ncbi:hypothetical protein NORO109296_15440 [Nocardiopsis rhodophaea]|uniref:hypothetical protein n=1 Tax=Nocardiopsis rhodophaea TaxID=280238 RepID=UPI0031DD89B6
MAKVDIRGASAITAVVIVCTLAAVSGCGVVDTGVRVEAGSDKGTANPTPEPGADPHRREAPSVDPVAVLREDPGVSQDVKDLIAQPCSGGEYGSGWFPLYASYTTIDDTDIQVVAINVQGCSDVVACTGVQASYVYRIGENRTKRVYTSEERMGEVIVKNGDLFVQRPVWQPNDPPACPRGGELVPLSWDGTRLVADGE